MKTKPLVSVCVITFNHETYISETLEGILNQKINYDIEIVIGEDFSTDKTREICEEYSNKRRGIINLLPSEKNLGVMPNFIRTLNACKGKYIAICEGDDYWTDPYKLQKQVDFLEGNPEYGMVCTDYSKLFEKDQVLTPNCFNYKKYRNEVGYQDYIIDRSSIGTATVMIRKDIIEKYQRDIGAERINTWRSGDTALWLYLLTFSKAKVMQDNTAVYRINAESASKFKDGKDKYLFRKSGFDIPFFFLRIKPISFLKTSKLYAQYYSNEMFGAFLYGKLLKETQNFLKLLVFGLSNPKLILKSFFCLTRINKYK